MVGPNIICLAHVLIKVQLQYKWIIKHGSNEYRTWSSRLMECHKGCAYNNLDIRVGNCDQIKALDLEILKINSISPYDGNLYNVDIL